MLGATLSETSFDLKYTQRSQRTAIRDQCQGMAYPPQSLPESAMPTVTSGEPFWDLEGCYRPHDGAGGTLGAVVS